MQGVGGALRRADRHACLDDRQARGRPRSVPEEGAGSAAVKKPTFAFGKATTDKATFQATAYVLENTGVQAYLGQAGKIKTPGILLAAATIATVEARHAGAIAELTGKSVSPDGSFDVGKSKAAILSAVTKTGFIKS